MKGWIEEGRRDRLEKRLRGIRLLNAAGTPTIKEMVMTIGGCKKRRDERMMDKFSERGEFVAEQSLSTHSTSPASALHVEETKE